MRGVGAEPGEKRKMIVTDLRESGSTGPGRCPGSRRRELGTLLCLVVAGAALRFFRIGHQSFWVDELLTIRAANLGTTLPFDEVFRNIQGPFHAVLVHLVGSVWISEAALRSLSALFGVASIPVAYALGAELFDRRSGLAAAALAAVSPFSVWYSQELRNYSLLIFFSGLATLVWWRLIADRSRAWSGYVVSVVLALLSNLAAAFLVVAHAVAGAARMRRGRGFLARTVSAWVIILVLMSPWIWGVAHWAAVDEVADRVTLAPLAEEDELLRGRTTFSVAALPYTFYVFGYGYSLGPSMAELHRGSPATAFARHAGVVAPAACLWAAALALGLYRARERGPRLMLILGAIAVPIAGAGLLAILNVKPFNPRYVSVMLPVLWVTAGAGVACLGGWGRRLLLASLVVCCLVSVGNYHFRPAYWREDVRAAAEYVEAHERPGDVVLIPVVKRVFDFYFDGDAEVFVVRPGETGSDESVAEAVAAGAEGHGRLWLVDARLWFTDPEGRIPRHLEARYGRGERTVFPGSALTLYVLDDTPQVVPSVRG